MQGEMRTMSNTYINIRVNRVAHYYWLRQTNKAASSAKLVTADLKDSWLETLITNDVVGGPQRKM
jgi:hypothetical protein